MQGQEEPPISLRICNEICITYNCGIPDLNSSHNECEWMFNPELVRHIHVYIFLKSYTINSIYNKVHKENL
jgi:hypothetical protein